MTAAEKESSPLSPCLKTQRVRLRSEKRSPKPKNSLDQSFQVLGAENAGQEKVEQENDGQEFDGQ